VKRIAVIRVLGTYLIWIAAGQSCPAQAPAAQPSHDELLTRVQHGDRNAIIQAGATGDTNFVSVLESIARPHFVAQVNSNSVRNMSPEQIETLRESMWRPMYDDPIAVDARVALAKLGIKDYLDEILTELTDPAHSPVCKERDGHPQFRCDAIRVRNRAFDKLAYIRSRSTVRPIASFLSVTSAPASEGDIRYDSYANMAMRALTKIVNDPPQTGLPEDSATLDARSKIWQHWWKQNKDKYP
jgi:hypothetical protein